MTRFVVLDHDHPTPHLDLLFEVGAVLWAWRLDAWPVEGAISEATRNFDHRLAYLDFEGPLGGGRGRVRRLDRGEYTWLVEGSGRLEARIIGERWRGVVALVQEQGDRWCVQFRAEAAER